MALHPATPPPPDAELRAALEAFAVDNPELDRLEGLIAEFNVFEALGIARQEVRHSDFLSFLLDPRQTHGLDDLFTRRFLQGVLASAQGGPVSVTPLELELWDLGQLVVRREWQNVDILLLDERNRLAVIVENKIDSDEHSGQLRRYYDTVQREHPGYQVFGVYLTPDGELPSDDRYVPAKYDLVCRVVERLLEARSPLLHPDIRVLVAHYVQMLRRHIVQDSPIAQLCRDIYRKHQRALDLIFDHRPDLQSELRDELLALIEKTPHITPDHSTKMYIRFVPKAWEKGELPKGSGWTQSGRMLLFGFTNVPPDLNLVLSVGPGPTEIRRSLFDYALTRQPPFKVRGRSLHAKWDVLWARTFLSKNDYENATSEELRERMRREWEKFVAQEIPALTAAVVAHLPQLPVAETF